MQLNNERVVYTKEMCLRKSLSAFNQAAVMQAKSGAELKEKKRIKY